MTDLSAPPAQPASVATTAPETGTAHGWPRRTSVCGIPELPKFASDRVSHLLSILDPAAEKPAALAEFRDGRRLELRFDDVVGEYHGYLPPQEAHLVEILAFGEELRAGPDGPDHLLVHCHMGISRSTAAMAILLAQHREGSEEAAFARLFEIRPRAWPNSRMVMLADRLLGRAGRLVEALKRHQRRIIAHHPDIADLVISVGRGHELPR
ncbi:MAG: protein-tyrosine-phosphatase [Alphaproteobacteria bacterium]|nr:protein-tyrosine-phosphatase [Alphaproteobacteria bacterium]